MRNVLRKICIILLALMFVCCGIFLYAIWNAPAFDEGECYTFYSEKNSSCRAYVSDAPALDKLLLGHVAGESVRYAGDRQIELEKKFRARLLFTEEVCGIVNYYYESPDFRESVMLYGRPVNLHIAVGGGKTTVGTPLIFGGF